MAELDLAESAWGRGKRDTSQTYKSSSFMVGASLVTILAGAVAIAVSSGKETDSQIAATLICGAAALALTLVAVFIAQLATAPLRQRNELRAAWSVPEEEPVDVGLKLQSLHAEGTEMQHRFAKRRYEIVPAEKREVKEWADSVAAFLARRAPEAADGFLKKGKSEPDPVERLGIRLQALQAIINEGPSAAT